MRKLALLIILPFLFIGCESKENSVAQHEMNLNDLEIKLQILQSEYSKEIGKNQKLEETVVALKEKLEIAMNQQEDLPSISNWNTGEMSGLMKYVGTEGMRTYPSNNAPILILPEEFSDENMTVFCCAVIGAGERSDGSSWGVILINDFGEIKSGYVPYSELEPFINEKYDYIESLNEFHLGDRIEKVIGILDRDFVVLKENNCIYKFYDLEEEESISVDGEPRLLVLVTNDFRVGGIRTYSDKYKLNSGYSVGDNAIEVIEYYSNNYPGSDLRRLESPNKFEYKLSEDEYIAFYINEDELTESSVISYIEIF